MISAIVPVWNGRELLMRLLDSLDAQTQPIGELLVVDNGSADGAPEAARQRGARVIAMGRNAGFAAAVNRGIEESRGDWLAVLNSDVVMAPDYLAKLLAAFQRLIENGGSLIIIGSVSNIIVVQQAQQLGVTIGFREFSRLSIPATLLALGGLLLWVIC